MRWWPLMLILAISALLLAACSTGTSTPTPDATSPAGLASPSTTPSATATAEPTATATTEPTPTPEATPTETPDTEETRQVTVYFLRDEKIAAASRSVPAADLRRATEALEELLKGPTEAERAAGLSTAIPEGTELRGVNIENGVATVDLSGTFESGGGSFSMGARLAQVVYTVTQFPTVQEVQFRLDGEPVEVFGGEGIILDHPVGRANYEDFTPAILVESPMVGDVVESPVRIHGTANTFEATFQIQIIDAGGDMIVDQFVTATSGSGIRGTFDVTIPFTAQAAGEGLLRAFEYSAKDGSEINIVEIPVQLVD